MRVLLSGSHGVGKTTTNLAACEVLTNFECIDSMSKLFFKNKEDFKDMEKMPYTQLAFNSFQVSKFMQTNNIISSRGFADIYAYTQHLNEKHPHKFYEISMKYLEDVVKAIKGETLFVYFPVKFPLKGHELRSTNQEFQNEIDIKILDFFYRNKIDYYTMVSTAVEDRVEELISLILSHQVRR